MMRKRMLRVLSVMLICIFALSACKKNVGTPEDNAVTEETQDSEETEEDTYVFGFTAIDMENPYFITLEAAMREAIDVLILRVLYCHTFTDTVIDKKE